ncbi:MAG: hypothetical protein WA964_19525 [Ilumatobacter sp.]|uniref:hypothetical protein n=1 Tax=Ilumatobacter sp. TaxID=1967498 RepID=UPI003C75A80F
MAATSTVRHASAPRRRHAQRQPFDRRELERRGWRTTLDYQENHERDDSGVLGAVTALWRAEGEWTDEDGAVIALVSIASSPAAAWRRLRVAADSTRTRARSEEVARR